MTIFGEFDVDITIPGSQTHYIGKVIIGDGGNFNIDLHLDGGLGTFGHLSGHLDSSDDDPEQHVLCYEFTQHVFSPGLPEIGAYSGHIPATDKDGDFVFNGPDITILFHKTEEQKVQSVKEEQEAQKIQEVQEAKEVQEAQQAE